VALLGVAVDLAEREPAARRAELACRLAIASAEGLLFDAAVAATERALAALGEAHASDDAVAPFLARIAREFELGGARRAAWEPLVERGLSLLGARRDLGWA